MDIMDSGLIFRGEMWIDFVDVATSRRGGPSVNFESEEHKEWRERHVTRIGGRAGSKIRRVLLHLHTTPTLESLLT